MASNIFTFLIDKRQAASIVLRDIIAKYENVEVQNRGDRMERASIAFDQVRTYIKLLENQVFPSLERYDISNRLKDAVLQSRDVHDRLERMLEKTIMIHVDEPFYEFRDNLVDMMSLLTRDEQLCDEIIFVEAMHVLTPQHIEELGEHIEDETHHETHRGEVVQIA